MQSVLFALLLSHIPPPSIGIEARKVKKFTRPIKWLLVLMASFFFWFRGVAGAHGGGGMRWPVRDEGRERGENGFMEKTKW